MKKLAVVVAGLVTWAMACGGKVDDLDDPTPCVSASPSPSGPPQPAGRDGGVDVTDSRNWSTMSLGSGFAGSAFDGHFLYLVPGGDGVVVRYDIGSNFGSSASWSKFDVSTVDSSAVGFRSAAFDGRYIYLAPYSHADGSLSGTVARYDTQGGFASAASWSTFDASSIHPGAKGFVGVEFDGHYLYFVPYGQGTATDGVVVRYDTTASFGSPSSWATFDTSTLDPDAVGYYGATFDGRYLYLSPYATATWGSYSGRVTRFDTHATFTSSSSWSIFDTTRVDPSAKGFFGATFDGRYTYFVPYKGDGSQGSMVARYDTRSDFGSASSWSVFDTAKLGVCPQGAVFDGRYVYLVASGCPSGSNGVTARFDTEGSFTSPSSWTTFDTSTVNPDAVWFWGGAFDGEHVYLIPSMGKAVARFDATTVPSMPPSYFGSFF